MKKKKGNTRKRRTFITFLIIVLTSLSFVFFSYVFINEVENGTISQNVIPAFLLNEEASPSPSPEAAPDFIVNTSAPLETEAPSTEPTGQPTSSPTLRPTFAPKPTMTPSGQLIFAGDILLDGSVRRVIEADGLQAVFPDASRTPFIGADIAFANLETSISLRGAPMPDKEYTYRSDPEHAKLLSDMGLDIVSLANNHTIDYGRDAFADTMAFLDGQNIAYIGAGNNMAEAMDWHSFELYGKTFAFLAASRVVPVVDWYAGKERSGMFGTYDPADLNAQITAAKEVNDYVIVYVHWGVERNPIPEQWQRSQARGYIEAGADFVVGSHPHILQGFEFIDGKLVVYSLGNFIFSDGAKDTGAINLTVTPEGGFTYKFMPYEIINRCTVPIDDADKREALRLGLNEISFGAIVNEEFEIVEK